MTTSGAAGYPSGGAMRRWTRLVVRTRAEKSVGELLGDVYTIVLTVAVTVAMVGALARNHGLTRTGPQTGTDLDTGWLTLLAALAVLGFGIGLLGRTGPVSLGAAQAGWWLPLPGERGSLLRPSLVGPTTAAAAVGAITGLLLALAIDPALTLVTALAAALAGLLLGAALALGLVPVEAAGRQRAVSVAGDGLLALTPVAALALVLAPPGQLLVPTGWWPAGVGAVLLVLAWWRALRSLPHLHDTELRERGAAAVELRGATLATDTRDIGRALDIAPRRARRRRSARLRLAPRLVRLAGPGAALATADALLLLRSPRRLVQLVCGAALALVAPLLPQLPAVGIVLVVVSGAWISALATGLGARDAQAVPAIDALLPVGQRAVRGWRLVVPVLVMLLWSLPVFAVLGRLYDDVGGWLALGLLAAPVWAGGIVRSAYRPPPDFSGPLIVTPMGAYPKGLATLASTGPDVILVGAVPLAVAVLTGSVTSVLLGLQLALTALAVALAVRAVRPKAES
ncbi:hypothetical protein FE251_10920 [Georgenia wutianyii]|uniref:ABC transporter permease n=1 Tax=Georgenia wutianyii TaxID=2585135 RepID=A0ABX5VRT3_9MICO|nr:DUF6297 family protein [Georgenia wutianyii]QDB79829.1 hypothetical protein FE251_10920 [Georgenia wutianyii]